MLETMVGGEIFTPVRPDYGTVHTFICMAHGKASDYTCSSGCGKVAREWAYLYNSRHEQVTETGRVYAGLDALDCYVPLCKPCHAKFDVAHGVVYSGPMNAETRAKISVSQAMRYQDPEARVKLALSGKKGAQTGGGKQRFRCDECGLETVSGALGVHQKHAGHTGKTRVVNTESGATSIQSVNLRSVI